jgi:hypothetical protein
MSVFFTVVLEIDNIFANIGDNIAELLGRGPSSPSWLTISQLGGGGRANRSLRLGSCICYSTVQGVARCIGFILAITGYVVEATTV